jgi:hypothetical protein
MRQAWHAEMRVCGSASVFAAHKGMLPHATHCERVWLATEARQCLGLARVPQRASLKAPLASPSRPQSRASASGTGSGDGRDGNQPWPGVQPKKQGAAVEIGAEAGRWQSQASSMGGLRTAGQAEAEAGGWVGG